MKNDGLVSIIVPVYNTEVYLRECIESVLRQSYKKFELLLIDDGSCDNSLRIAREFNRKDERIKVYKKNNTGVSDTRNFGIKKALGEYIVFIDSDDTVRFDYLSKLVNDAKKDEMPVCEIMQRYKNKDKVWKIIADNESSKYEKLETSGIEGYSTNRIYQAKIIKENNVYFDTEAFLQEDLLFNYNYVKHIKDIKIINEPLYNYRMRKSSAIRGKEDLKTLFKIEKFCKKEKISTQKIEYSIIRAYIINKDKNIDYRKRFITYLLNRKYSTKSKAKLIARAILRIDKKSKYELYE